MDEKINKACESLREGVPDGQPLIGIIVNGSVQVYGELFDLNNGSQKRLLQTRLTGALALQERGQFDDVVLIE